MNDLFEETDLPNGATYLDAFASVEGAAALQAFVDDQPWLSSLRRRVQHYGWRYNYQKRQDGIEAFIGPLPDLLNSLGQQVEAHFSLPDVFNQAIVNEYEPGQGISAHIDCVRTFGPTVAILSLGSPCTMVFSNPKSGQTRPCRLYPRSLLLLQGEARHGWAHAIPPRKTDKVQGLTLQRSRRVSITLRCVQP